MVRLRQLLARDGVPMAEVFVGMASRNPGEPTVNALAQEARQRARDYAGDN